MKQQLWGLISNHTILIDGIFSLCGYSCFRYTYWHTQDILCLDALFIFSKSWFLSCIYYPTYKCSLQKKVWLSVLYCYANITAWCNFCHSLHVSSYSDVILGLLPKQGKPNAPSSMLLACSNLYLIVFEQRQYTYLIYPVFTLIQLRLPDNVTYQLHLMYNGIKIASNTIKSHDLAKYRILNRMLHRFGVTFLTLSSSCICVNLAK